MAEEQTISLVVTPLAADANSYATVEDADTYLSTKVAIPPALWFADTTTPDSKARALIAATRYLDRVYNWNGTTRTATQVLRWPRSAVVDQDGNSVDQETIPANVRAATIELAALLLEKDRLAEPSVLGQGFSSAKLGPLEVTVDPSQVLPAIPYAVDMLVSDLGSLRTQPGDNSAILPLARA